MQSCFIKINIFPLCLTNFTSSRPYPKWSRAKVDNAILAPEQAIQHDISGKANVTVINQKGQAQSKTVQLGQRYQNSYIVTQGLQAGEKIIVEGTDRIQPNQPLIVKQWQAHL